MFQSSSVGPVVGFRLARRIGGQLISNDRFRPDVVSKKKSKKKKAKQKKQSVPAHLQEAAETRTAVATNVAWMLSLMSTLMAEGIGLICRWYTALVEPVDLLTVLSRIMLFVALISGIVTLIMIPLVYRFNKTKPPAFIVQLAVLAGGLPLAVLLIQYLTVPR